jgi:formylglycine-generating enzyme required for sulfatase activity
VRADASDEEDTHATDASWSCNAESRSREQASTSGEQQAATAMTVGVPPPKRKSAAPVQPAAKEQEKRASSGVKRWLVLPLLALLAIGGYVGYTSYRDHQTSNRIAGLVLAVNSALDQGDTKAAAVKVEEMEVVDATRASLYRKKVQLADERIKKEKEIAARNATVEQLRSEIEAALERKDSAAAGAKIAALENVDEALAADCRKRLDEFVRENDAKPAYTKAVAAQESIAKQSLDKGQGIGARLRLLDEAFSAMDSAWQTRKWAAVVSGAAKVQALCTELETLGRLRKSATAQKEGAEKVRQTAEQAGVPKLAEQLFVEGEKASIRAGASFESGDFEAAVNAWKEAATAYGVALAKVKGSQSYGKAKEAFEAACKQQAVLLEKYGGPALKKAQEKERVAVSLEPDPEQGKKAYEEAQALLLVAIDEAKARKTEAEKSAAPKLNENYVLRLSGDIPLELVWIKAGTFMMGSPKEELDRQDDEALHRVTLTKGFWLGKVEVTQGQWEAVTGMNPSRFTNAGKQAPVEQVSWEDAQRFCEKLTQIEKAAGRLPEGYVYTLPTEAQWEYACRAGTSTPLNSGKTPATREGSCPLMDEVGWYSENSQGAPRPVGGKKANDWGLFDMHGNVWEWCRDYCTHKGGVVTDTYVEGITDPLCKTGIGRVCRGGGCFSGPGSCWSANRSNEPPTSKNTFIGLRLALAPVQ